jgi:UDP-2,3-diacylglucosamine pyrophosphatase LpxH
MKNKYRAIWISDIHLGTKDCKAELLCDFLKHNSANTLYLVGDIIDGWRIQQNKWKWKKSHTKVIRKILDHSKKGSKVVYVVGNHDEFLRPLLPHGFGLGNIDVVNKIDHIGKDGRRYLVIHGDMFDGITKLAPWLGILGDKAYDLLLSMNSNFNWLRHKLGFGYWSLSKYLKHKVKGAVDFIFDFENNLVEYCRRKYYDGVICGHIHHAEIKTIQGITYMNDGDWVESCTALVEHHDGQFEIITWNQVLDETQEE